jgi:hypothetical protein
MSGVSARGALAVTAIVGVLAGCSGSSTTTTSNGNGSGSLLGAIQSIPTPDTLVTTCEKICNNVVAECVEADSLLDTCLSGCEDLNLVSLGCVDPFATYLACLSGATSVTCQATADQISLQVTPPQCAADRSAAIECNAAPGLVSACIAVPGSSACDGSFGSPAFCIGAPDSCLSPEPNPLGIGVYCCP